MRSPAAAAVAVVVVALASDTVNAAGARGVRHFEDITGDLPNEPITAVVVDAGDDEVIYAGLDGFVFWSDDGGESWRVALSFPRGSALDDTDADLSDAGDAAAAAAGAAPLVEDGGGAAGDADADGDGEVDEDERDDAASSGGAFDGAPAGAAGGAGGALDDLPDGDDVDQFDEAVAFARTGPGVRALRALAPGVVLAATPRGLYRSVNRGASFERLNMGGGVRENDVRDVVADPMRPSRLFVATAGGLLVSKDGGASFAQVGGTAGSAPGLALAAAPGSERAGEERSTILYGSERGLFRSTDGGDTFLEVLLRGLPPFTGVAAVAIERSRESYYAGTSRGLYVGERSAALLERHSGIDGILVQALDADPARARGVVVGTRTRGVWFSGDAGLTVDEGAEQVPAAEVFALARPSAKKRSDDVIVATDRGLFVSRPGTGVRLTESALKKLRAQWAQEPTLDETAFVALEYSRLRGSVLNDMQDRARWAWGVPRLSAELRMTVGTSVDADLFILRAGDELPPGVDPANDQTDLFGNVGAFLLTPQLTNERVLFVSLVWDLDKLILNHDELGVARRRPELYRAQRRVLEGVRAAWIARRRLMSEIAVGVKLRGASAAADELRRQLRIDELTAQLDAATGGTFSSPGSRSPASRSVEDAP